MNPWTDFEKRAAWNKALLPRVLKKLRGGIWHATCPDRFEQILIDRAILPEPPSIPDSKRWSTSQGRKYYPYVRLLGGVSLFDFSDFDSEAYSEKYPNSSWTAFIPCHQQWDRTVWIEVDRTMLGPEFISGFDLLAQWRSDSRKNRFMPLIEAAHIGPVPRTVFKQAFLVQTEKRALTPLMC